MEICVRFVSQMNLEKCHRLVVGVALIIVPAMVTVSKARRFLPMLLIRLIYFRGQDLSYSIEVHSINFGLYIII